MDKLPTLFRKGVVSFDKRAKNIPTRMSEDIKNKTAIDIILSILETKYNSTPDIYRSLYLLKAGTGSSKSTGLISNIFKELCNSFRDKLIVTEPRVNLTISNAQEVIRYNPDIEFGSNIGVLTGDIKIECKKENCLYYCTTQILTDKLKRQILEPDKKKVFFEFKYIIIDEVHTVDAPMIELLKIIKEYIKKFSNVNESPIFILSSATIDIDSSINYFFETEEERETFYSNYLSIINVPGAGSNFNREERYLSETQCKNYNFKLKNNESPSKIISDFYLNEGYKIEGDALIICPTMRFIEEISNNIYENIKNDAECLIIEKGDEWAKVLAWRGLNRNKKRIIIIRYAKNYSEAADTLMLYSKDPDAEAYENEKKIMISSPIVETGKTFSKLTYAIDLGLQMSPCYNPLTYFYGKRIMNQIPENMTQVVQRKGRVGRECDGIFRCFFSKEAEDMLDINDIPATINNYTFSYSLITNLILEYNSSKLVVDLFKLNDYIYKISFDIMLISIRELINHNVINTFGEIINYDKLLNVNKQINMIEILFYIFNYSLFEAALTVFINEYELPNSASITEILKVPITVEKLNKETRLNERQYKNIAKARQFITKVMYSDRFIEFPYLKNRIFKSQRSNH